MALEASTLAAKSCTPCRGGVPPLTEEEVSVNQRKTPEWDVTDGSRRIERTFKFKNFAEAFGFVNRWLIWPKPRAITRMSASAGATPPCRCKQRRSKDCTR